jgi:rhodanese-related sulfurtransferase
MKRGFFAPLLVLVIAFSGATASVAANFPDMDGVDEAAFVEALAAKGIVSGMGDGLFHPGEKATIGQYAKMIIYSAFGAQAPTDGDWASGYVKIARDLGILDEYDAAHRDSPLTRLAAARIGHQALTGIFSEKDDEDISAALVLKDLYACGSCVDNVAQSFVKGIIGSRPGDVYDGDAEVLRGEAAAIVAKILDPVLRTPPTASDAPPALAEPSAKGVIDAEAALEMLNRQTGKALIFDVRSPEEYSGGHIPGSVNIPLDQLASRSALDFPDKEANLIVYCQKGSRSARAYELLRNLGYAHVFDLGGIESWPYEIVKD